MSLPLLTEYSRAIQKAAFFKTEKGLTPIMQAGEPLLMAGAYGCVFKMLHSDGSHRALKCFTKYVPDKQQRLETIAAHLNKIQSPHIVHYRYLPEELWVNSEENKYYAVLLMEWVEGKTLGEAVREATEVGSKAALQRLADNFTTLSLWLLAQDFAHGDLKHDNILVRSNGTMVLIDYDGMYVPGLLGKQAENKGVEEYQHPMRTLKHFDTNLDDYAIAIIAAALVALAQSPELYKQFGETDRMLFKRADLLTSTSPLKTSLQALQHPTVNALLQLLQESIIAQNLQLPGLAKTLQSLPALPNNIAETELLIATTKQKLITVQHKLTRLEQHLVQLKSIPVLKTLPRNMVLVRGGTFEMGDVFDDNHYENEKPVHQVTLSDFYMAACCVTFDEYDAFCVATQRQKPYERDWEMPVINITWYDAVAYCNWLSVQDGRQPVYTIDKSRQDPNNENKDDDVKWIVTPNWQANGYRLPTEAEWEYAAREGGKKVRFGNGQNILKATESSFNASSHNKEPYSEVGKYHRTVPTDSFKPNSLGLYNMSGNVWEWCWDWFDWNYYQKSPANRPRGPENGSNRVLRGGCSSKPARYCRVAYRSFSAPTKLNYFPPVLNFDHIGFRLVFVAQLDG